MTPFSKIGALAKGGGTGDAVSTGFGTAENLLGRARIGGGGFVIHKGGSSGVRLFRSSSSSAAWWKPRDIFTSFSSYSSLAVGMEMNQDKFQKLFLPIIFFTGFLSVGIC